MATGSLVERMIGAARLDATTYEEVEHDTNATTQALLVVVLTAIAGGIGALGNDEAGRAFIGGLIGSLIGWVAIAAIAFFIGTRLFATTATSSTIGELLRTLGFARTPLLLSVVGFIPILGPILALVGLIWFLVATIVALRQALDFTTGRAIGTGVVSLIAYIVVLAIVALILGVDVNDM